MSIEADASVQSSFIMHLYTDYLNPLKSLFLMLGVLSFLNSQRGKLTLIVEGMRDSSSALFITHIVIDLLIINY